jgi:hypothetical protein
MAGDFIEGPGAGELGTLGRLDLGRRLALGLLLLLFEEEEWLRREPRGEEGTEVLGDAAAERDGDLALLDSVTGLLSRKEEEVGKAWRRRSLPPAAVFTVLSLRWCWPELLLLLLLLLLLERGCAEDGVGGLGELGVERCDFVSTFNELPSLPLFCDAELEEVDPLWSSFFLSFPPPPRDEVCVVHPPSSDECTSSSSSDEPTSSSAQLGERAPERIGDAAPEWTGELRPEWRGETAEDMIQREELKKKKQTENGKGEKEKDGIGWQRWKCTTSGDNWGTRE